MKIRDVLIFSLLLLLVTPYRSYADSNSNADKKISDRVAIGSTFSAPVKYENNLYFLATTGVLYKSNLDLSSPEVLFDGKKQTISSLTLYGTVLYWGEGVHADKSTTLHAYDLKANKMIKETTVDGHIERGTLLRDNVLYVGLGYGGIAAFKASTLEKIWQTRKINGKDLHSDGNIVFVEKKICTTAVYDFKGIVCLELSTGKITNTFELKKNPKSEIVATDSLIVGFATEANLSDSKWNIPSDLYVVDVKNNKLRFEKELRGFNFFAPLITADQAYVTLSTGDFNTVSLKNGNISYIGEFAEPFINNPFMHKNNFCALGIMGKFMCFSKNKNGYGIANDSRIMETPIGKIVNLGGKVYAPSRIGYFIVE
ncbi:MAG: hypothetical protein WC635_09710 [Bacteriovorax sp.]|jgi:outer membrane protein assembly factor BamB